ncbi:MAG: glycosyltransferase family 4 protein, partial [Candidatus Dormibacteraeota bacterium]|nr:glycosyltransferase family 4 protein [Candidatus Dormibacteraeota bacterium]
MRVLHISANANDPRHRRRDLALLLQGVDMGLVLPDRYGHDWAVAPVEPELPHWRSPLRLRQSIPFHAWSQVALTRAIDDFKPDLVDVHEEPYFIGGIQATLAARRIPVVMYAAQTREKFLPPPFGYLHSRVLRRVRAFYPCCLEAADLLRRRGFQGPLEVVPLGVEEELFAVQPTGDRIGFIGHLVVEKGVDQLMGYGSRLLCIGAGPLELDLRAAGAEVRVARSTAEIAAALAQMAVLVAPSITTPRTREQFGRALAEAMAAGVPVVAYDTGAFPEVVGDAGIIVEEGDRA